MGASKEILFSDTQNHLAKMAKAISHPARIAIIQHLAQKKECVCGDIVNEIGLAQATVSQHLKELKLAGIIQGNIEGKSTCYCLNPTKIEEIKELFNQFLEIESTCITSCC